MKYLAVLVVTKPDGWQCQYLIQSLVASFEKTVSTLMGNVIHMNFKVFNFEEKTVLTMSMTQILFVYLSYCLLYVLGMSLGFNPILSANAPTYASSILNATMTCLAFNSISCFAALQIEYKLVRIQSRSINHIHMF